MKARRNQRPRHADEANPRLNGRVQLWMLRMLVPLNAQIGAVRTHGFAEDSLAMVLGLEHRLDDDGDFDQRAVRIELRDLYMATEEAADTLQLPDQLTTNVRRLAGLVGLSSVDCRILEFAVMLHCERILDDVADHLGQLSTARVHHMLASILDLPQTEVRQALDGVGLLARSGLLAIERSGSSTLLNKLSLMSDQFADRAFSSHADPVGMLRDAFAVSTPGHLSLMDFEHLRRPLDVLQPYLRKAVSQRRTGVNVLLYGAPGTGKNQLVKALAAALGCELFEVSSEDEDGDPVSGAQRLRAYRAAQSVLSISRSMILFDEVQDIFELTERERGGGSPASGRKAWINRMLEGNPIPAFWLANSIHSIDPAFLRRFDMVLETPVPPIAQRTKILEEAFGPVVGTRDLERIAACEKLTPAVAARAASVVAFVGSDLGPVQATDAVLMLVDQALRAQGHRGLTGKAKAESEIYDPRYTHADADMAELADGLKESRSGRLCLFGPPGTGKTAWAHWLARQLEMPLLLRRASDLMSKWVGGNERNIAAAFAQAKDERAILLIDEVDSFLRERGGAHRSWEVSLVNEMLTQMEVFDGIFVASTNLMQGMDSAALRRFDLKVKFDYLRTDQSWELLVNYTQRLGLDSPATALKQRLDRLEFLAPGDFAAAARQHRFRRFQSADDLIRSVEADSALKNIRARPIGFI